jgi:hypothetical protein
VSASFEVLDSSGPEPEPVFVDTTGRRRRRLRWAGYATGTACAGYSIMLAISLMGGPVSPRTLLPLPGVPEPRQATPKLRALKPDRGTRGGMTGDRNPGAPPGGGIPPGAGVQKRPERERSGPPSPARRSPTGSPGARHDPTMSPDPRRLPTRSSRPGQSPPPKGIAPSPKPDERGIGGSPPPAPTPTPVPAPEAPRAQNVVPPPRAALPRPSRTVPAGPARPVPMVPLLPRRPVLLLPDTALSPLPLPTSARPPQARAAQTRAAQTPPPVTRSLAAPSAPTQGDRAED